MANEASTQQEGEQNQHDGGEQPKKAERTYSQADLDRITSRVRKNAQSETEARLRRELAAQSGKGEREQQRQQEQETELKPPKREDFEDYDSWRDAQSDYVGRKAAREEREKQDRQEGERKANERAAARAKDFKKGADALIEEVPEFAEKIADAGDVMVSRAMSEAIEDASEGGSSVGARMLMHLVDNPAEAERIAGLSVSRQFTEMAKIQNRIEAELEAKKKAKEAKGKEGEEGDEKEGGAEKEDKDEGESKGEEKEAARDDKTGRFKAAEDQKTRKAPDPIEPGAGRGGNNTAAPSDKDSDQVWLEKRNAEIARERQGLRRRAG